MRKAIIFILILFTTSIFTTDKTVIAVAGFKRINVSKRVEKLIRENITTFLIQANKYDVVERNHIDKILKEHKLSDSDLAAKNKAVKIGRLVSARGIVTGSIIKLNNRYIIILRLVDTQSGRIIRTARRETKSLQQLTHICRVLAYSIANVPLQTGSFNLKSLINAVLSNSPKLIRKIIANNVNINAKDKNSITPLIYACYFGKVKAARTLLKYGAKTEIKDSYGQTALHNASFKGYYNVVKLLLDAGADVNAVAKGNANQTPLMYAVFNGHTRVVRLLVNRGANVYIKNSIGRNSIDMARTKRRYRILRILQGR